MAVAGAEAVARGGLAGVAGCLMMMTASRGALMRSVAARMRGAGFMGVRKECEGRKAGWRSAEWSEWRERECKSDMTITYKFRKY